MKDKNLLTNIRTGEITEISGIQNTAEPTKSNIYGDGLTPGIVHMKTATLNVQGFGELRDMIVLYREITGTTWEENHLGIKDSEDIFELVVDGEVAVLFKRCGRKNDLYKCSTKDYIKARDKIQSRMAMISGGNGEQVLAITNSESEESSEEYRKAFDVETIYLSDKDLEEYEEEDEEFEDKDKEDDIEPPDKKRKVKRDENTSPDPTVLTTKANSQSNNHVCDKLFSRRKEKSQRDKGAPSQTRLPISRRSRMDASRWADNWLQAPDT